MKGRETKADGQLLLDTNKLLRRTHQRAHVPLVFHAHTSATLAGFADAGWANRADGSSQGGRCICAVNAEFLDDEFIPVSFISWESKKLPRVARSTPSAETQALSEMVGELDYVRLAMCEFETGPVHDPHQAFQLLREIEAVAVVDCKPTYDAMVMSESSALGLTDMDMAIEAIACRQDVRD